MSVDINCNRKDLFLMLKCLNSNNYGRRFSELIFLFCIVSSYTFYHTQKKIQIKSIAIGMESFINLLAG